MLEIQKTFDFFKATAASDRIDRIIVSGGASRAEGFTEMLAERFEAPVEAFDPFKRVTFDAKKLGGDAADVGADRRGGGRPRAAAGGGPMIRINLLAVERGAAQARAALIPAAHRVTIGASLILLGTALVGRLVVLVAAPDLAAARRRHRPRRNRDAAAALGAGAGAEVRGPQGAAPAAGHADRAAAPRPDAGRFTSSTRSARRSPSACGSPR